MVTIQSNSVITNSSGPAIFVRYNRVNLCTKLTNLTSKTVITECSLTTEFVITKFHCTFSKQHVTLQLSENADYTKLIKLAQKYLIKQANSKKNL